MTKKYSEIYYNNYVTAKEKIKTHLSGLKKSIDWINKKQVAVGYYDAIYYLLAEVERLAEIDNNKTDDWYDVTIDMLTSLDDAVKSPNFHSAGEFLINGSEWLIKSSVDPVAERLRNGGKVCSKICSGTATLSIALAAVALALLITGIGSSYAPIIWGTYFAFFTVCSGILSLASIKGSNLANDQKQEVCITSGKINAHILITHSFLNHMVTHKDRDPVSQNTIPSTMNPGAL